MDQDLAKQLVYLGHLVPRSQVGPLLALHHAEYGFCVGSKVVMLQELLLVLGEVMVHGLPDDPFICVNDMSSTGGDYTAQLTKEEELLVVRNAHLVSPRIGKDMQDSKERVFIFKSLFPELYSVLKRVTPEETFDIYERYKDHPVFREDIHNALTPHGREWIIKELEMIKKHAESESRQ